MRGLARFVEDLLGSRRPRRFRASGQDADVIRAAITLRAARPGSATPREGFVAALHERLAAELDAPATALPHMAPPAGNPRRRFLAAASLAAGAAAAGAGLDHALAGPGPGQDGRPVTLRPDTGSWQAVLASAELPDGSVRAFDLGAFTGFVRRQDGLLHAVSGICTHQGCRLQLPARPDRLVCPCHGASFKLDGTVLAHRLSVTLTRLPLIAVREGDGAIEVYAPQPGQPAQ
jgi:nitrite reductase/ring-hydroxylating ferredoxin subunit